VSVLLRITYLDTPISRCNLAPLGIWNPNRRSRLNRLTNLILNLIKDRHDDPEEQEHDRIREEIRKSHRFQSFANIRDDNTVKWSVPILAAPILSRLTRAPTGILTAMVSRFDGKRVKADQIPRLLLGNV
jgi:hypothetical protein